MTLMLSIETRQPPLDALCLVYRSGWPPFVGRIDKGSDGVSLLWWINPSSYALRDGLTWTVHQPDDRWAVLPENYAE